MENENQLQILREAYLEGDPSFVRDLSHFLPVFKLHNEPMNLRFHFQISPLYQLQMPKRFCLMCARQLGKSYGIASQGILQSLFIRDFHTLYIQPRFDQIKTFSNTIVRPLIQTSPLKGLMTGQYCEESVLIRSFKNNSRLHFSYCFTDAERIRGITGISKCAIDEAQDINTDFIPVIGETMSASIKYGFYQFTGTPKTTDNTLNVLFEDSSMAEWVIPCHNCRKLNVPNVKHDLLKMIGKIGLICAKCGKKLDARKGWFEHAVPEKRTTFAGYHISQPIHPLHYVFPEKWNDILYKMEKYPKYRFFNEVLGQPCDESLKLISVDDLRNADNGIKNTVSDAIKVRNDYETVVLGVDWGGGGMMENSYTVVAIVGLKPGVDKLDCIYAERFPSSMPVVEEINQVLEYATIFRASYIAHDYCGAGALREILMEQSGVNQRLMVPFSYVYSPHKEVITYNAPTGGNRQSWSLDKSRSLVILCNMLKGGKVSLPDFKSSYDITKDLCSLTEEYRELPRAPDIYLISKTPKTTDDFAHALNYACSAIWHTRGNYPSLMEAEKYRVSVELKNLVDPSEINWN